MPARAAVIATHGCLAAIGVCIAVAANLAIAADPVEPKRVLLIHSFARDSGPFGSIASVFRTDLARRWPGPLVFHEASLEAGQHDSIDDDKLVIEFLHSRFLVRPPDLIVAVGPPASRFCARHRQALFPDTPRLLNAEERLVRNLPLGPNDRIVGPRLLIRGQVDTILKVLPNTQRVAIAFGNSRNEQFWVAEFRRQLAPFDDRVQFIWLNELSLDQMRREVADLPGNSAILYAMLTIDGAGTHYEGDSALSTLRAATSAPIFGIFDDHVGRGAVGGMLVSTKAIGEAMSDVASHMLRSGAASTPLTIVETKAATFDWRELKHWKIDEAQLPPGSVVQFREPSAWEQYRLPILGGATLIVLQAALITALLVHRMRRRRAEHEVMEMSGRLIHAHEDERRRIAGELHDDLTQRLARLAIDTSRLEHSTDAAYSDTARSVRQELVRVSEDVHDLSYKLHPSMLDDLGLVAALRAECARIARQFPVSVDVDIETVPDDLPADISLCLFRVAQEALRNVVRHARASNVAVSLKSMDGGLQLGVSDDGVGFDEHTRQGPPSLGLASMAERVRHIGGEFEIESAAGHGTNVIAWVPLARGRVTG